MSDGLASKAAAWKARRGAESDERGASSSVDDIDLRAALADEPDDSDLQPPAVEEPVATRPPAKAAQVGPKRAKGGLPAAIFRRGDPKVKGSVDVPLEFEELRKAAKEQGMTATHLVLAAAAAHGDTLLAEAKKRPFLHHRRPSRGWTLIASEEEFAELDGLVAELAPAFGKESRTAVVAELLSRCGKS